MISAAVVATAVLQKTVNGFNRETASALGVVPRLSPPGLVFALGALFVAVLAFVYLPCHTYMRERGERLLDECLRLCIRDANVADKIERRNLIRTELDLRRSARESATDAIVILGPLVSGALALWISPGS